MGQKKSRLGSLRWQDLSKIGGSERVSHGDTWVSGVFYEDRSLGVREAGDCMACLRDNKMACVVGV